MCASGGGRAREDTAQPWARRPAKVPLPRPGPTQDEDTTLSFWQLIKSTRGRVTVAMDILSLVGMAPFLVIESATFTHYGFWGWASLWNVLDVATYALQVTIVTLHLGRIRLAAGWLSVAAALQCILLLFRLQYFSRVFKSTRFAFLDDIKEARGARHSAALSLGVQGGDGTAHGDGFRLCKPCCRLASRPAARQEAFPWQALACPQSPCFHAIPPPPQPFFPHNDTPLR